jgi:hypothetical protein
MSVVPLQACPPAHRYRSSEAMPDDRIRDFARNWAPEMRRTPNGYMKARPETFENGAAGMPVIIAVPGAVMVAFPAAHTTQHPAAQCAFCSVAASVLCAGGVAAAAGGPLQWCSHRHRRRQPHECR